LIPFILPFFAKTQPVSQYHIAIFASGSGTNAENIVNFFRYHPSISVKLICSNNTNAYVLTRAKKLDIPAFVFDRTQYRDGTALMSVLKQHEVSHIVLAGFLWLIPEYLIRAFPDRIINIHPALLPRYGGRGMYGARVHEAVKAAGDLTTGITIHLVNERYDDGKILFQASCDIAKDLTPDEIAECVHKLEYEHYPTVIENWILGRQPTSTA